MVKIRAIFMMFLACVLVFSSCGKISSGGESSSSSEAEADIAEIMRDKIKISKKEADNENSYYLTMPDYGKIFEGFDGKEDIEQFVISNISGEDYPEITVEIQTEDNRAIDLTSPEVKKVIEDEFTKAINALLEAEGEED